MTTLRDGVLRRRQQEVADWLDDWGTALKAADSALKAAEIHLATASQRLQQIAAEMKAVAAEWRNS